MHYIRSSWGEILGWTFWLASFDNLLGGHYILKETAAPTGYESSHLNVELAGLALILLGVGLSRRFTKRREDREYPKL